MAKDGIVFGGARVCVCVRNKTHDTRVACWPIIGLRVITADKRKISCEKNCSACNDGRVS